MTWNKNYILIFVLAILLEIAYLKFQGYKPIVTRSNEGIMGISVKKEELPYPSGSIVVSETKTENINQITLKTPSDYIAIRKFYENILLEKKWVLDSEDTNETFQTLRFKKGKNTITTISSINMEEGNTLLSIEITKR